MGLHRLVDYLGVVLSVGSHRGDGPVYLTQQRRHARRVGGTLARQIDRDDLARALIDSKMEFTGKRTLAANSAISKESDSNVGLSRRMSLNLNATKTGIPPLEVVGQAAVHDLGANLQQ